MADGGFGPVRSGAGGARSSPYDRAFLGEPDEQQILAALGMGDGSGEACQFFSKAGWCKFGDACRFAHIGEPRQREACEFFAKAGWCKWGDQCKHAHAGGPAGAPGQPGGGGGGGQGLLEQLLGDPSPFPSPDPPAGGGGAPGQEACQFFSKAGWCKWGDACRFAHVGAPSAGPGPGGPPMMGGGGKGGFGGGGKGGGQLSEACQFFVKAGWCKWGDGCRYAHIGGPAGPAPGAGRPPMAAMGSPRAMGEVCEFFSKAGWCKWGDACRYVHSGAPQAPAGAAGRAPAPMPGGGGPMGRQQVLLTGQTMVCKYFNTPGGCRNGEMCTFSHVGQPGAAEACGFFQKAGWCKWGDQCKYIHSGGPPGGPQGAPGGLGGPPGGLGGGFSAMPPAGELQAAPPMNGGLSSQVCQFFQKAGWCKWADQCKYVHTGGPPSAAGVQSAADAALLAAAGLGEAR